MNQPYRSRTVKSDKINFWLRIGTHALMQEVVIPILQNLTTDRGEYHISRVKGKIWQEFIR
jgi:hypothetical protein